MTDKSSVTKSSEALTILYEHFHANMSEEEEFQAMLRDLANRYATTDSAPETNGTWEERCAALYQVIGSLADFAGVFTTSNDVSDALDVAAGRGDVDKLLPWPKDVTHGRTTSESANASAGKYAALVKKLRDPDSIGRAMPLEEAAVAIEELSARSSARFASVPRLVPGNTPGKQAAWDAFYAEAKGDIPHNADGSHSGTFWVAVMRALNAYIDAAPQSLGEVASAPTPDRDAPAAAAPSALPAARFAKCTGPLKAMRLRYTTPELIFHRIEIDDTCAVLVIGGDGEGAYEWVIEKDGKVESHSDAGYGLPFAALRDGLTAYWPPQTEQSKEKP